MSKWVRGPGDWGYDFTWTCSTCGRKVSDDHEPPPCRTPAAGGIGPREFLSCEENVAREVMDS